MLVTQTLKRNATFNVFLKKHILHYPDPEDYTVDHKLHKLQIFILKYFSRLLK